MEEIFIVLGSIVLFIIFFYCVCAKFFSLCQRILDYCCCCNKTNRHVLLTQHSIDVNVAPVVVTQATHTAPGGYPVSQMPPPGSVPANVYVAAPYPTGQHSINATNMPVHVPPAGYQHQTTPYPPYPPMGVQSSAAAMNPPSYEAAVSGMGTGAANAVPYEKQAPYNPNYSAQ